MSKNLKLGLAILIFSSAAAGGNVLYQVHDKNPSELAKASINWPSVSGIVNRSELEFHRDEIGADRKTDLRIFVTYEYVVEDRLYRNDVVRFDQGKLPGVRKELLVSAYSAGQRVNVFYNPDDPDQSVLVRGSYE